MSVDERSQHLAMSHCIDLQIGLTVAHRLSIISLGVKRKKIFPVNPSRCDYFKILLMI